MVHFPWGRMGSILTPCSWDFGSSVLICKLGTLECLVCNARIELEPWACCRDQAALSGFLTLLYDSPTIISEPQTTDPWHAPWFHGSSEVSGTGCHCGHRLPKSQAWTRAPHPVRLGPSTLVSRQHCKLKPCTCFLPSCFVFFFFLVCVGFPLSCLPQPPLPKILPRPGFQKILLLEPSHWSGMHHILQVSFSSLGNYIGFRLLIYLNSLQSGSACRGECFFSAPGLSFQVEQLPTKHYTCLPPPLLHCLHFPLLGSSGEPPAWWVMERGWCLFLPCLEPEWHSEQDSTLSSCPECWSGSLCPLWEEEEECGDTQQQESGKPKRARGRTLSRKCCTLQVHVTNQHLSFQMVWKRSYDWLHDSQCPQDRSVAQRNATIPITRGVPWQSSG